MPARDRAAYMREYRKRKGLDRRSDAAQTTEDYRRLYVAELRVTELEAEVARLKRELAARRPIDPHPLVGVIKDQYSTRPFTPVPKIRPK